MKNCFFILLLVGLINGLIAGRIERAYEALEKYDYFTAKELFSKTLDKEPVAAPYGLSIIYGRNDNPFYNLDSAYYYIVMADSNFITQDDKSRGKLLSLKIDSLQIENWKDTIDSKVYNKLLKEPNINSFQTYIALHNDSKYRLSAIEKRNSLAFEEAKKENSSISYQYFYNTYPKANQVAEAKNRFERRLYIEHTLGGEAADYSYFIKKYPNSPYVSEALDSVYIIYTKEKTEKDYYQFILDNPKHPKLNEAWRNIYKLYMTSYDPERILEFRMDYPAYPFVEELKQDMKLAAKVFLSFKKEGKWGFMDTEGEVMIRPIYSAVEVFSEGLALVVKEDKIGFINKSGKVIIPFEYDDAESFVDGLAVVSQNENYGMIDRTNKTVIPLKYELVGLFNSGLALVASETAYGYINRQGEEVIPLKFEYATDFKNGYAVVELNGKKGMINTIGEFVIPPKYSWLEPFNENQSARAKNDSLYGMLGLNGEEILPFKYDMIGELSKGKCLIAKDGKYGYTDKDTSKIIAMNYDYSLEALVWAKFEHGYTKFKLKEKYGIIDSLGEKVFPAIFEDVKEYYPDRLVAVKKRGKWGYTNESLRLVIDYKFEDAFTFRNGKGIVKKGGLYGIIDDQSKYLLKPEYDQIKLLKGVGYIIQVQGQVGLLSEALDSLLNVEYEAIKEVKGLDLLFIKAQENSFYFDLKNKRFILAKEN